MHYDLDKCNPQLLKTPKRWINLWIHLLCRYGSTLFSNESISLSELMLYIQVNNFSVRWDVFPGLTSSVDKMFCSKMQHKAYGEAWISNPSITSHALYQWANALLQMKVENLKKSYEHSMLIKPKRLINIQFKHYDCFVCLFCCFMYQVNSYGHCGTVSSPNHTFSWAGLNKRLTSNSCTYFCL